MRGRLAAKVLLLVGVAVVAAGCGAEDFPTEPRPAAPVELSALIDDNQVVVAPSSVGAGLATITISNQSEEDVVLNFDGPNGNPTDTIRAGGVAAIRLELEQGDYTVEPDVSSISSANLSVGEPRPSAQNELLLP